MLDPIFHPRDDGATERLGLAVVIAALLHLVVLAVVQPTDVFGTPEPLPEVRADRILAMTLVDEDELLEQEPQRQYVSLPEPQVEERPDDASFYDRFERAVERETVNRDDVLSPSAADRTAAAAPAPSPSPPAEPAARRPAAAAPQPPAARQQQDDRGAEPILPEAVDGVDTSEQTEPSEATEASDGEAGEPTQPAEQSFALRDLVIHADPAADALVAAASRRNDYLDVDEGDRTALNSLRSMYWSFFNRMQEQLSEEWDPSAVLRRYDPTSQLYGRSDRYTVLSVTLDGDGSLRHVVVDRSSQLDFLDDEAVRAFQVAAPFPNVPEGLKDENGQVTFQFGFHVSFERGTYRIRRVN